MKIFATSIRKFGIVFAIVWVLFIFYLPPFQSVPHIFKQELSIELFKSYTLVFLGILSGILMFYSYKLGKVIAFVLAVVVLSSRIVAMFPNILQKSYALYILMLQKKPLTVIHNDVLLPLFMIYTILYLFIDWMGENNDKDTIINY